MSDTARTTLLAGPLLAVTLLSAGLWFGLHAAHPECGPPWLPTPHMTPAIAGPPGTPAPVDPCTAELARPAVLGALLTLAGLVAAISTVAVHFSWPRHSRR